MSARDDILNRIRSRVTVSGRSKLDPQDNQGIPLFTLDLPVPQYEDDISHDLPGRFKSMLEQVHGTLDIIDNHAGITDHVSQYLKTINHGAGDRTIMEQGEILISPAIDSLGLDWREFKVSTGKASATDRISVTYAFAGIAETGTVAMVSSPDSPVTLNFLPEINIIVLDQSRLVATMEAFWSMLDSSPRVINFITGPSKTGDIEQTIIYGAHGPKHFHVILVGK